MRVPGLSSAYNLLGARSLTPDPSPKGRGETNSGECFVKRFPNTQ